MSNETKIFASVYVSGRRSDEDGYVAVLITGCVITGTSDDMDISLLFLQIQPGAIPKN